MTNDLNRIIVGDETTSMQLDLSIKGVQTGDKYEVNPALYEINVYTERGKDLCNTTIGFPIFTEVPCVRMVSSEPAKNIREKAHEAKYSFTIG